MGRPKKKEPAMIQAQEFFTNQQCPNCSGYLTVSGAKYDKKVDEVFLYLTCLGCDLTFERFLLTGSFL